MRKKNNPIAIVIAVIALILAAYAVYTVTQLRKSGIDDSAFKASIFEVIDDYVAEKSGQKPPSEPVEVSVDDDAMRGDENAPVTILEFSDYECPFCARYVTETLPKIIENYVDTGKVKYVFRDFPLGFHENAKPAANAAECVREQGGDAMYFEYHDVLFNNQKELGVEKLKEYAADFDIDQTQFASCVDEGKFKIEIENDIVEGQEYGVQGTPAFFVNGIPMFGAQPYAAFEAAIEKALNE